jgi:hypothetical protein
MAQLTYDEIRLLRELKNSNRKIGGNKPHGGLNQLAKEGVRDIAAAQHFRNTLFNHSEGPRCAA